jgi:L-glutamine:2-deoxy-scyllo-inosose/3-amino-2,3-dideoxy-scyllo-inosose aminotransferase
MTAKRRSVKGLGNVLAIRGGAPAVNRAAPAWPIVGDLEVSWMESVVRSGQWSWKGPHEMAFSEEYRNFIGSRYCLCLANGTVTLQCALQAVGVEPGHEVIVPGLTWCATAQAAFDIGADVVFVDIDPETLCMDPKAIEKAITKRTKAIIPVHLYGCMCDMDAIMDIAKKHDLKVVEDVAHQHGSRWRNRGAGAVGDVGSFSFQQSKVLTCGEGGAVTCNDESYYTTIHCLKQVGWDPKGAPGNRYGHNYRITEMQAVLLRGGLRRLTEQTQKREEGAAFIREGLQKIGGPLRAANRDPRVTRQAYYGMTLQYDSKKAAGLPKQGYLNALTAEGCGVSSTYWPVYAAPLLNLYDQTSPVPYRDPKKIQDYRHLKLPEVEKAVNETAVILSHPPLLGTEEYLGELLRAIQKVNENLPEARKVWEEQQAAAARK